jgi:phosphonopyruvate decarboxylase
MIEARKFDDYLRKELGVGLYTGVPDTVLRPFCNYLYEAYGISAQNMICVNEGSSIAYGSGAYLAGGKIACVFMQNSGLGNAVNPLLSLAAPEVYRVPLVLLIGWRGAPGENDEPQHISQGRKTEEMLRMMRIPYLILDENSGMADLAQQASEFAGLLREGYCVAFLAKKNAFANDGGLDSNETGLRATGPDKLNREMVLQKIAERYAGDYFVATTGLTSRELYEVREKLVQGHDHDFLTVGSMGHASAIALGAALHLNPGGHRRIWCLDGDGAALMHLGAMATIGTSAVGDFIHVLLNNEAHESVGGLPTAGGKVDFLRIAEGCGYDLARRARSEDELRAVFSEIEAAAGRLFFLEIKTGMGSRRNLGRPAQSPLDSGMAFARALKGGGGD